MQFFHETDLIAGLKVGDEQAVAQWYAASRQKILGFFLRQVGSPEDAAELTQDTYISCLSSLPLFRGQSSLYSWMMGIARHELADYWRKKYAKRAIALLPFGQEVLDLIDIEGISGIEARGKRQEARELQELLRKLPDGVAELLQLKYIDGYSVKQLAAQYGLSLAAMQSRLFRAKEVFRQAYEKQENL